MNFRPRTLGNGRVCCSNPTALCDKCKAHQEENTTAHETEGAPLSAHASFKERYAAEQTRMFADLRAATRRLEAEIAANPPTMRALENPDDVPTAWAAALEDRTLLQSDLTPDLWPGYSPLGRPPNGYDMALALLRVNAEAEPIAAAAARPEPTMTRDANGIPSAYDNAIAAGRNV